MYPTARTCLSLRRESAATGSPRRARWLVGGLVMAAIACLEPGSLARAAETEGEVKMGTAVEVPSDVDVLYKVTYEYSFSGRESVFIDGVGTLPARGRLTYLNSGGSIRFLDKFNGQILRTVTIKDPVRFMGGNAADLPRESEFPEAYRQGRWTGKQPFAIVALAVLDRFFPNGYRAYRRGERQHFLTMFATLPPVSERIQAQVAVLVSSPVDADPHDLVFTVQFSARERRSRSEWRRELNDSTQTAVQVFVGEVLAALERGAQAR